jgi:hypothetical protein
MGAEPYPHDEIKLGSWLLTIIEPHKGHEVAYNRWYERDHFYSGCMIGPWTLAGSRFVATRDCKDRRPDPEGPGSYIALYWIQDGKYKEWVDWGGKQVMWLHENGRMFAEREHIHTIMYKFKDCVSRDADGVPPELALDRRYPGIIVVIGEAPEGVDPTTLAVEAPPIAMCIVGTARPLLKGPDDVPRAEGSDQKFVHIYFVEDDPRKVWDDHLAKPIAAMDNVTFASPFLATIPGTDTYTDQLW